MALTRDSLEKLAILAKLEKLLDCAGVETTWELMAEDIRRLRLVTLRALLYRVERARAEAYEEGYQCAARANATEIRW